MAEKWSIQGEYFENCNCEVLCPCIHSGMQAMPKDGHCDVPLLFHIDEGRYGDVELNGLNVVSVLQTPGPMAEGNGTVALYVDERADDKQREALAAIFSGEAGGWWKKIGELFSRGAEFLGVERAKMTFEIAPDQSRWGVDIPGKVKAWAEALSGPTSTPGEPPRMSSPPGSETGHGQIVTWGKSTVCKVDAFGINYSWTASSAKHSPFDWSND